MLLRRYGPFSYQTLDSLWPGTKELRLKGKKRLISSNISATKNEVKSQKYYYNQIFNPSARLFAISELTEYIFELCLVMDDENFSNEYLFPPNIFIQVCRLWREVALNNPRLWAKLKLSHSTAIKDGSYVEQHSGLVSSWLKRSNFFPLSLKLHFPGRTSKDVEGICNMFKVLVSHADRWYEIDITAPMSCIKTITRKIGEATPLLQFCRFSITSTSEREDVAFLEGSTRFRLSSIDIDVKRASRLKEMVLCSDILTDVIFLGLPASLQRLSLNNISPIFKDCSESWDRRYESHDFNF